MKTAIVIKSQDDRRKAFDAIKSIRSEPVMVVTIAEYKKDRSAAQNSLYWAWLTDCQNTTCNEQAGRTKDEWHDEFKEKSLLNIYIRDNVNGTAETMAALYEVKLNCDVDVYSSMRNFVIKNISTTDANVTQFTEYLTDIERFCQTVGIQLRTDSDMYRQAMGKK